MKFKISIFIFALLLLSLITFAQPFQKINTLAGSGTAGFSGDGTNASGADLWAPLGVAVDATGNVYIADHFNYRVRKVFTNGLITTIAGTGLPGLTGDGSIGSSAQVDPIAVAVDRGGNVYISDPSSNVVRKVDNLGLIHTVAGNGLQGYSGNGGPATAAKLNTPAGIALDAAGNLYIADQGNHVVRKVNLSGIISDVAGNDILGNAGAAGVSATSVSLDSPYAVAVDKYGNLYIDDYGNNIIRRVTNDSMWNFAGDVSGTHNYLGDSGPATAAFLDDPRGLAVDTAGNVYISDANNNVIRKVGTDGIITTVVGNGTFGFGGDLGYAIGANLFNPYGVAVDAAGSIYIADANNERVRKTYSATVGIAQLSAAAGIAVFPNPFSSAVTISGLAANDKVRIYDVLGRQVNVLVAAAGNAALTVETHNLSSGIYLLNATDASGTLKAAVRLVKE